MSSISSILPVTLLIDYTQMFPIEIDSEVLAFLRDRIEDFNETPNSVLRRELRIAFHANIRADSPMSVDQATAKQLPSLTEIPLSAPEALSQIMEVVQLVRGTRIDRVHATVRVAERRRIERETVADKYGRQMGLSTDQFDRLVAEPTLDGLREKLCSKFPSYSGEIRNVLAKLVKG